MKIGVLIPSEEYRGYAGARIRYGRIAPGLAAEGHTLTLADIAAFDPAASDYDVLLISKCHDPRALVAAELFAQRGRLVGIDLFDDYFSQWSDARLVRYRAWLAQLVAIADFALCSTDTMAAVAHEYRKAIATHVMNDPSPDFHLADLAESLETRCLEARQFRKVRLCWFGVGDNPHFPVGLSDLANFGTDIARIARGGYDVELTVLTNARAVDAARLEMLVRLPIRTTIEEWTETRERALLGESLAAFIPVNAQGFSTAKSLNRAVTALNAGCQVIATGFPLYAAFDELVYRNLDQFVTDLDEGALRLSAATLPVYAELMDRYASPRGEAAGLATFLTGLAPHGAATLPIALIHGLAANGDAHKQVRAQGGLSVGSPFCNARLGFDVIFDGVVAGEGLAMLVSDRTRERLRPELRHTLTSHVRAGGAQFWLVRGNMIKPALADWADAPMPLQLAAYRSCMDQMQRALSDAFGPCRLIWSENSLLPFAPPVFAALHPEAGDDE